MDGLPKSTIREQNFRTRIKAKYMADKLGFKWLLQTFYVATSEYARGQLQFLLMDGRRMALLQL